MHFGSSNPDRVVQVLTLVKLSLKSRIQHELFDLDFMVLSDIV